MAIDLEPIRCEGDRKPLTLTLEQVAWIAGIIEGEGNMYFCDELDRRKAGNRQSRLKVVMTDKDVIHRLYSLVPGSYVLTYPGQKEGHKRQWHWFVTDRQILVGLLTLVIPWLGQRRAAKANALVDFILTHPHRKTGAAGVKNRSAKLNDDIVRFIRKEKGKGFYYNKELAVRYGVSWATIYDIQSRRSWSHVE